MISSACSLDLYPGHWAEMETDARAREPEEACGLVAGIGTRAELVIPVTNALHSPSRFRMDPMDELRALTLAEEKGLDILAVYHSHPAGPSQPSATDHEELTIPGIIYLIWYKDSNQWCCRGFLMVSQVESSEVPIRIVEHE
jgi:proteasome lid subunit RPN8/RPN11